MDNSNNRLHDVFFYGLYMDEEILKTKGVNPRNQRAGVVSGYKLRVGKLATLLRCENSKAYGLVYSLTYDEVEKLYAGSGLTQYIKESLLVNVDENKSIATLCCNLLDAPSEDESNEEYSLKLKKCMEKYNLPFVL